MFIITLQIIIHKKLSIFMANDNIDFNENGGNQKKMTMFEKIKQKLEKKEANSGDHIGEPKPGQNKHKTSTKRKGSSKKKRKFFFFGR